MDTLLGNDSYQPSLASSGQSRRLLPPDSSSLPPARSEAKGLRAPTAEGSQVAHGALVGGADEG